jgi:hypothetical protein
MKKLAHEYDYLTIPDKTRLLVELSKANELRHRFWKQLRAVRNQVGRYIIAHEIQSQKFSELTNHLSPQKRKFFETEWMEGRKIPLYELKSLMTMCNKLWTTNQSREEAKREFLKKHNIHKNSDLFLGPQCEICRMSLTGRQKKYCSDFCRQIAKSRRWRSKNPEKKQKANLKYLKDIFEGD